MGCSYTAYTVIGCRVLKDKLYNERQVKAFDHNFGEDMKFDPQTGKPLWRTEQTLVNGDIDLDGNFGEFSAVTDNPEDDEFYYIGVESSASPSWDHGDGPVKMDNPDLDKIRSSIKAYLEPFGLWDEAEFGIWTVPYVGC